MAFAAEALHPTAGEVELAERHVVCVPEGPSSAAVRSALAAFRASTVPAPIAA